MLHLPSRFAPVILSFAPLFFQRSWQHAEVLLLGAILPPGKRTVTRGLADLGARPGAAVRELPPRAQPCHLEPIGSALPVARLVDRGLRADRSGGAGYRRHHRAAPWQTHQRQTDLPRPGAVLAWPLRESLRPAMAQPDAAGADSLGRQRLGVAVPDSACPIRARLREHGWRHRRPTDWARQLVLQTRRWVPERDLVLIGDSGFAALELLDALARQGIVCITRLRLNATLYEPAAPRLPGTNGRPRTKGARLPNLFSILAGSDTGCDPTGGAS